MAPELHPEANLLSAWLEGNLSRRAAARVSHHLSGCGECRRVAACAGMLLRDAPLARRAHRLAWAWHPRLALAASTVLVASMAWAWSRAPQPAVPAPAAAVAAPVTVTPVAAKLPAALPPPAPHRNRLPPAPPPTVLAVAQSTTTEPPPVVSPIPTLHFTPATAGFADQPVPFGAQRSLAAWAGGSSQAMPVAQQPSLAARLSYAGDEPLDFSLASVDTSSGPWGLGWAGASTVNPAPVRIAGVPMHVETDFAGTLWAAARTDQVFASSDHGAHWRAVVLPGADKPAVAVVSIDFQNSREGAIRARGGAAWLTHDGGTSWVRSTHP